MVPHRLSSADLAPCEFVLLPRLKSTVEGQRFQDAEEIKANTVGELETIPLQQLQRILEKRQDCRDHCISSGGECFEGDVFR